MYLSPGLWKDKEVWYSSAVDAELAASTLSKALLGSGRSAIRPWLVFSLHACDKPACQASTLTRCLCLVSQVYCGVCVCVCVCLYEGVYTVSVFVCMGSTGCLDLYQIKPQLSKVFKLLPTLSNVLSQLIPAFSSSSNA